MLSSTWVIARKELMDHARDIRSVAASLLYLLMGPLVILLVSFAPSVRARASGGAVLGGMISIFVLLAPFVGGMNVAMDMAAAVTRARTRDDRRAANRGPLP